MTSLGLGRRRAGQLAMVPWAGQFGLGPLGQETGKTLANELYHGGFPPPIVEIPIAWIRPSIQVKHDPPIGIAEVARTGGQTARAVNEATITASQGRAWKFTATVDSVAAVDASNLAQHAVDFGTMPRPRSAVITLVLNGRTDTEIWRILGVKQGAHIRLTGAPGETTILNSNQQFDGSVADWSGQSAATIAPSALYYHNGSGALEITPPGAVATVGAATTTRYEVFPATDYVASAWLFSVAGWSNVRACIDWYDAAGSFINSGLGSPTVVPAAVWTQSRQTLTSPSTAAGALLRVRVGSTPAASDIVYADDATLTGPRPGRQWPAGALDHVVSGISHQFSADARIVMWTTSPIVGTALGEPGPWFYTESSLTSGADTVPA